MPIGEFGTQVHVVTLYSYLSEDKLVKYKLSDDQNNLTDVRIYLNVLLPSNQSCGCITPAGVQVPYSILPEDERDRTFHTSCPYRRLANSVFS